MRKGERRMRGREGVSEKRGEKDEGEGGSE